MAIEYLGLSEINGPLVALEGVKDAAFDEIVEFSINDGEEKRLGRIIEIYEDKAIIQVFEGSEGMSCLLYTSPSPRDRGLQDTLWKLPFLLTF